MKFKHNITWVLGKGSKIYICLFLFILYVFNFLNNYLLPGFGSLEIICFLSK